MLNLVPLYMKVPHVWHCTLMGSIMRTCVPQPAGTVRAGVHSICRSSQQ